jgi:hypothetical protein
MAKLQELDVTCGCGENRNFCVKAGATFYPTIRWAQKTLSAAIITAITQATPVVITAPDHGMPNGWPAAVAGVQGMSFINSNYPPSDADLQPGTVVDVNTVSFNDVSSALWPAYVSGGSLVWYTPQPLTGVTFAMSFYTDSEMLTTPLIVLTNALGGSGLQVDETNMLVLPVLQTNALPEGWPTTQPVYYKLTATDTSGDIIEIMSGTFTLE